MELMEVDSSSESIPRSNSIWLHGVDEQSTDQIKKYVTRYTGNDFKVEWINDSSLNIVFEEDDEANEALTNLTLDKSVKLENLTERQLQMFDSTRPDLIFTGRITTLSDRKVKNAAVYSRYYLFNPKEERSKKRGGRRRRSENGSYRERDNRSRGHSERIDDLLRRVGSKNGVEQASGNPHAETSVIELFPEKVNSSNDIEVDFPQVVQEAETEANDEDDLFSRLGIKRTT